MSEQKLVAKYSAEKNPLKVGDIEIPCYVLNNGQRVISQGGMIKALGMSKGSSGDKGGDRLAKFVQGKLIKQFISSELIAVTEKPLKFRTKSGKLAKGYDAETLQQIVRGVSKAYLQGRLLKQQIHIGEKAEKLDDAFSKIGLIALIDEATGYQYDREAQELQKILKAYISDELLPWQQRFPHEFYREIFRLRGWSYTSANIRKKPSVVGHWTNRLIYGQLPRGVLKELKEQTPKDEKGRRKHHYHRLLTTDVGHPHLGKQLAVVIALMNISKNWREFIKHFNTKFGQQEIQFDEVEEVRKIPEDRELSTFNKSLKTALDYNPNKDK